MFKKNHSLFLSPYPRSFLKSSNQIHLGTWSWSEQLNRLQSTVTKFFGAFFHTLSIVVFRRFKLFLSDNICFFILTYSDKGRGVSFSFPALLDFFCSDKKAMTSSREKSLLPRGLINTDLSSSSCHALITLQPLGSLWNFRERMRL